MLVIGAFDKVLAEPPFAVLGVASDNDSTFMRHERLRLRQGTWAGADTFACLKKERPGLVEQKNDALVRRLVRYGRLSGAVATQALAELDASSRLYINFFQPSLKLKSKTRDGARVHKVSFTPATPCDRLLAHRSVGQAIWRRSSRASTPCGCCRRSGWRSRR